MKTVDSFILLVIFLILLPKDIFVDAGIGIDPSYRLGLDLANKENLIFGKDIVYTFGPLGYLLNGVNFHGSNLLVLLYYVIMIFNTTIFLKYIQGYLSEKRAIFFLRLIFYGLFLLLGTFIVSKKPVAIYFFTLFFMFHFIKHKRNYTLVIISIYAILTFYIKVNVGILINLVVILFYLFLIVSNRLRFNTASLCLLVHFIVLYGLSFVLNTRLMDYLDHSLSFVNYYNDAMAINKISVYTLLSSSSILLIIVLLVSITIAKESKKSISLFMVFNISTFTYIIFKSGFVRADKHILIFFTGITFIVFLGAMFIENKWLSKTYAKAACIIGIISVITIGTDAVRPYLKGLVSDDLFERTSNYSRMLVKHKSKLMLPQSIRNEISSSSVDILGSEVSYIFYNGLKYNPRPIFQSYLAYSEDLINLNFNKYESQDSPDFLLFQYGSIDKRYPFWDEPKTYLSVIKNYELKNGFILPDSLLFFKKRRSKLSMDEKILLDTMMPINGKIKIPKSENVVFLKLDYQYSLLGKLRRLIYRPRMVNIRLDNKEYTLIKPIMKSGVPINKKVSNKNEAYSFFNQKGRSENTYEEFELQFDPKYFNDQFRIQFVEYTFTENGK